MELQDIRLRCWWRGNRVPMNATHTTADRTLEHQRIVDSRRSKRQYDTLTILNTFSDKLPLVAVRESDAVHFSEFHSDAFDVSRIVRE